MRYRTDSRRGGSSFRAAIIFILSAAVIFVTPQKSDGGTDRSLATVGASVWEYANFLYLSELFSKPTATLLNDVYCVDSLSEEQIQALRKNIHHTIERDFWNLPCSPVKPILAKNADGTFDLRLKYINLIDNQTWIEKFQAAVRSDQTSPLELMTSERQSQLDQYYKLSLVSYFKRFRIAAHVRGMLADLKKIPKIGIVEHKKTDSVGEVRFGQPTKSQ